MAKKRIRKEKNQKKDKAKKRKGKAVSSNFEIRHIKMKVIGLGGGGTSIVSEMAHGLKNGVSFAAADTDARIFKRVGNKKGRKI